MKSLGKEENVILKSFDREILKTFEKLAPKIKRLYCTFGGSTWITLDNFLRFHGILENPNFSFLQVHKYFLTQNLINKAHSLGIKVIVWDVHNIDSMKKYNQMGVDFIESDHPHFVFEL